jgi:hypothetical protein
MELEVSSTDARRELEGREKEKEPAGRIWRSVAAG